LEQARFQAASAERNGKRRRESGRDF